tara:strand:+ start:402 stop:899 length:498 start_codon:yes stop_codon:yes gene_type:complete
MKKQLYCDIDSTINNHWERIKKWSLPSFPGTDIHPNAFTREEVMKDKVLNCSLDVLNRFKEEWDIHFLSARDFKDSYEITKDWLDLYKFPYTSINVVDRSSDKPIFLRNKIVHLFIDDFSYGQERGNSYIELYTEVIRDIERMGIRYEIFRDNWKEIENKYLEKK